MARPTPVLPAVASMMVPPGRSQPRRSASATMAMADAILDAAAGILRFDLGVNAGRQSFGHAPQPHQRSLADGEKNGLLHADYP